MLRSFFGLLLRFRWPVLFSLALLLVLCLILQPRPTAIYRLPEIVGPGFWLEDRCRVSPSGKYILIDRFTGAQFAVYDLENHRLLFTGHRCNDSSWGFDADDGLAYVNYGTANSTETDKVGVFLNFHYWRPGEQPMVVDRRRAYLSALDWSPSRFNGLTEQGRRQTYCVLSPGARTWIAPRVDGDVIHIDLLDARTGQPRTRLDMPPIVIRDPGMLNVDVAFSACSKHLLAVTPYWGSEYSRVNLFDVSTGKALGPVWKLDGLKYDNVISVKPDRVLAIDTWNPMVHLLKITPTGFVRSVMRETVPAMLEMVHDSITYRTLSPTVYCSGPEDDLCTYCWEHGMSVQGPPSYLPGMHYAVRSISTGELVHAATLSAPAQKRHPFAREGWHIRAFLPSQGILFQEPHQEPTGWIMKLEDWRQKYAPWWPPMRRSAKLQVIDAKTSKVLSRLSVPFNITSAIYSPPQQALYLLFQGQEDLLIHRYAYPLHLPWLMILGWCLGLLVTLMAVQMLAGLLFRHKHH